MTGWHLRGLSYACECQLLEKANVREAAFMPCSCGFLGASDWPPCDAGCWTRRTFLGLISKALVMFLGAMRVGNGTSMCKGRIPYSTRSCSHPMGEGVCLQALLVFHSGNCVRNAVLLHASCNSSLTIFIG